MVKKRAAWVVAALVVGLPGCGSGEPTEATDAQATASASASPAQVAAASAFDLCQQFGLDQEREYVGLSRAEADELAARGTWQEVRRVGVPETAGQSLATDSNAQRLNLVFDDEIKVGSACAG